MATCRNRIVLLSLLLASSAVSAASFECLVEPSQTVAVLGTATGVIEKVHVRRGDRIRKGQVLVSLESDAERASLSLAEFKAQMSGPLTVAKTKLEYATRLYKRRQEMHAENLMSGQDKDDAESEMKSAEAQLKLEEENHAVAQLELEQQRALFGRRTIRSTIDGVVADQLLYSGEVADASNTNRPILKLAQLDPLRVHVIMPRATFGKVKVGMTGKITLEAPMGTRIDGTVKVVDSLVDGASGTFAAFLEVPNSQLSVPSGVRCQVEMPIAAGK